MTQSQWLAGSFLPRPDILPYWLYDYDNNEWFGQATDSERANFQLSNLRAARLKADSVFIGEPDYATDSVALGVKSSDKGLLFPRVLSVDLIASPVEGLVVYDLQLNQPMFYDGIIWKPFVSAGGGGGGGGVDLENLVNLQLPGTIQGRTLAATAPEGIRPLTVNSTTKVDNLNADLLDGRDGEFYLNKYIGRLYVSVEGNDQNDGRSIATAVRTIKRAAYLASLTSQDETIFVLSGDYYEDNPIFLPRNTAVVGDNLRSTRIRPLNEGLDYFWVSSGCQVSHVVFRDNYGDPNNPADSARGQAVLNTGGLREIDEQVLQFNVFPGHNLKTVPVAFKEASDLIEYQRSTLVDQVYTALQTEFPGFTPAGSGDPAELETKCRRDIGFAIDALTHDLNFGGNVRAVQHAKFYFDEYRNLQFIDSVLEQSLYSYSQIASLAKAAIADYPADYPNLITTTDWSTANARIDELIALITEILTGGDFPDENPGPGYILIDQEWCVVQTITNNTVLLLERGVANPITAEPTVADRHISGAIVTQGARAFRYAVAYPDQDGLWANGLVTLVEGSATVNGIRTEFLKDFYGGGSIRVGNATYNIANVVSNTQLALTALVPVGQGVVNSRFKFIPKRELIYLSPYVQNCSNISVLGHSFYDPETQEYDAQQTRAGGMLVDGAQLEEATPIRSMVSDAFTQIVSGGIGFHLKRDGYAQLVSIFQVFEDVGVLCESGGYASVTNSATNFGREGLKAVGYSAKALPFFALGQVAEIENITKSDFNPSPSSIQRSAFRSEAGGTKIRVVLTVSAADINKFERGQRITIAGHNSVIDINSSNLEIDAVAYSRNQVEFVVDEPWNSSYSTQFGGATGTITVTQGSVFTQVTVSGFKRTPPANYIVEIEGLPAHPSGVKYVVAEILEELSGGFTTFSLQLTVSALDLALLGPSAPVRLYAPSTVNSSSHTFEFVGAGVNYTALPENGGAAIETRQNVEINSGRCYVSATDQDGNFVVGPYFSVNLRAGKVTFAGQVSLGILDGLELKASPGVPVYQFSTDNTLGGSTGARDTRLSTQKAVRDFVVENLGNFIGLDRGTNSQPGLIVQLDSTGRINKDQLPPLDPINVYTVNNEQERLVTQIGGVPLRQGDQVIQLNPAPATTYILRTALGDGGTDPNNWAVLTAAGGEIDASAVVSGVFSPSRLGTGTANDSTFLNGLNQFVPLPRGLRSVSPALTVGSDGQIIPVAAGPTLTVESALYADNAVTLQVTAHGFVVGDRISVQGVTPSTYNGLYTVSSRTDNSLTFSVVSDPGSYSSGGTVRRIIDYRSGFIDLDVTRAQYSIGQTSGSSSLGVARFAFADFAIDENNAVTIKDKAITLSRIQDIGPRTVLGNMNGVSAPVQQIVVGEEIAVVTTYNIGVTTNRFTVNSEGIDLGQLPVLYLTRGTTYRFNVTAAGHPFFITTSPNQVGAPPASIFTAGITGNGTESGVLLFKVPQTAPAVLYYQSGNNSSNCGRIVLGGDLNEEELFYTNLFYY